MGRSIDLERSGSGSNQSGRYRPATSRVIAGAGGPQGLFGLGQTPSSNSRFGFGPQPDGLRTPCSNKRSDSGDTGHKLRVWGLGQLCKHGLRLSQATAFGALLCTLDRLLGCSSLVALGLKALAGGTEVKACLAVRRNTDRPFQVADGCRCIARKEALPSALRQCLLGRITDLSRSPVGGDQRVGRQPGSFFEAAIVQRLPGLSQTNETIEHAVVRAVTGPAQPDSGNSATIPRRPPRR
jgi:hypothetical protein